MLYDQYPSESWIVVSFDDLEEVETVRIAFREHNTHLRSLGNDGSVSPYQKQVAQWGDMPQEYRGPNHDPLVTKLRYLSEATDEEIDKILNGHDNPNRITESARRYELGQRALRLVDSIELHAAMEADWGEVLGE